MRLILAPSARPLGRVRFAFQRHVNLPASRQTRTLTQTPATCMRLCCTRHIRTLAAVQALPDAWSTVSARLPIEPLLTPLPLNEPPISATQTLLLTTPQLHPDPSLLISYACRLGPPLCFNFLKLIHHRDVFAAPPTTDVCWRAYQSAITLTYPSTVLPRQLPTPSINPSPWPSRLVHRVAESRR